MNYEQLDNILKLGTPDKLHGLPLNRKERFYTGTVLPSLLFHNGLQNFFRFLHAIPGFPSEVNEQNAKDNFLFYTEYNLKESAGRKRNVGIEILTDTRDTPDVIIHILEPLMIFVIIESKMFQKLTQNVFNIQMRAQKTAVNDKLEQTYHPNHIFHLALVPAQLSFNHTKDYKVMHWQFFIDNKELDVQGNYFYAYLKFALDKYDKLRAVKSVFNKAQGSIIYNHGKPDDTLWVGRSGGRKVIEEDVRAGKWSKHLYVINAEKPRDAREGNWLSSVEFAEIVDKKKK